MKKIILFVALLAVSFTMSAQINLEHTFNSSQVSWFRSTNNGIMYYTTNDATKELKIYNSDYSLYKTIALNVPTSGMSNYFELMYLSDKLFNTDNKFEFLLYTESNTWVSTQTGDDSGTNIDNLSLYNEDGTLLKDFGTLTGQNKETNYVVTLNDNNYYRTDSIEVINSGSTYKLLVAKTLSNSKYLDVYSLPGSAPASNIVLRSATLEDSPAYPNPTKTIINIPYYLAKGENATLSIYNEIGSLIAQKQIDSTFDLLRLDVSGYRPGLYTYKYNNKSGRFIVN